MLSLISATSQRKAIAAMTKPTPEFVVYLVDSLQVVGPVYTKRMFGGFGIFLDGLMFGLVADNIFYLKADEESQADFENAGLEAFKYTRNDRAIALSYYQAPEEAFDSLDVMREWANNAYAAALRSAAKSKKSKIKTNKNK